METDQSDGLAGEPGFGIAWTAGMKLFESMDLGTSDWILAATGAFLVGIGKGGLPGVGNLAIVIFALVFPARESVGLLLPVLLAADVFAVAIYRRHALWPYIFRLLPWTVLGILAGYFLFGVLDDEAVRFVIGFILLMMTAVHFLRKRFVAKPSPGGDYSTVPKGLWFLGGTGILGGFATMVANAAGPVAALFLLASGLPKYAFIGTAAWFFLIVNVVKIPFMMDRGILSFDSLTLSAQFMGFAVLGVLLARQLVKHINQRWFEILIWFFIIAGGLRLIIA